MPKLSIIVPALNESECLPNLLADIGSLKDGFDLEVECLIVDGGSEDNTVAICRQNGARVVQSEKGRGRQLAAGAEAAEGDFLLFVHADCRLSRAHCEAAVRALESGEVIAGGFHLQFDDTHFILKAAEAINKLRFRLTRIFYGDHGLFINRDTYFRLGGYKPMPLFEDVEFSSRLKRAGRVKLISPPMRTSARRFRSRGIVCTYLNMAALHICYWLGVSPDRLAEWYRTNGRGC